MSVDPALASTIPPASPEICTGIADVYHGDAVAIKARGLTLREAVAQAVAQAKADGLVALIAKATQGRDFVDPSFAEWADAAHANGVLFGAYHFASASESGDKQADWFLDHVAHVASTVGMQLREVLMVLDYERNPNPGGTVTREIGEQFVERMRDRAGFAPVFYANESTLHNVPSIAFAQCEQWVASYGPRAPVLRAPYGDWFLWQYMGAESSAGEWPADERLYPRSFAGLGKVDRSAFRGTADDLRAAWLTVGA